MNTFLGTALSSELLRTTLLSVAKATLALALSLIIAKLLRRRSATDRYRIRVTGFAALLLVPLATTLLPHRGVPWLPMWPTAEQATAVGVAPSSGVPMPVSPGAVPAATDIINGAATAPASPLPVELIMAAIWLLGALLALVPTLLSLAHRHALRRMAPRLDTPEWQHVAQQAAAAVGFRGEVQLIAGGSGVAPMTWGSAPAVVIVPKEAATWGASCREAVLHHELAHALRRDANTLLWCRLLCACYWFNPLVWLACARLRAEQELAADELVLQSGRSTVGYADSLLQVLQGIRRRRLHPGVAAAGRRSELEHRIRSILVEDRPRPLANITRYGVPVVVALFAMALAPIEPAAQPQAGQMNAVDGFRLNWQLNGQDEEIALTGSVTRADQLSTLQFAGEGRLVIEARSAAAADPSGNRRMVMTSTSTGSVNREWTRGGAVTSLTETDRAWIDERLRYLVASLQLRDEERRLVPVRDSVMAAGGMLPAQLSSSERDRRFRALDRISTQRLAAMQRREQLAAGGAAPWHLLDLDREVLTLSWAELEVTGVVRP